MKFSQQRTGFSSSDVWVVTSVSEVPEASIFRVEVNQVGLCWLLI
jgi:hypothetical protein